MAKRKPTARRGQGQRKPRTPEQFFAQPSRRQATAMKAAHVLTAMRKDQLSLRRAAREEGIAPATVLRHAGKALCKTSQGTYRARKSDRLLRVLILPTPAGLAEIATLDSRAATITGEYWNAVDRFLETGGETELAQFRGVTITDAQGNAVPMLTDPDELERLGAAGILSFQSMYARAS
jgi:hypothetical protein